MAKKMYPKVMQTLLENTVGQNTTLIVSKPLICFMQEDVYAAIFISQLLYWGPRANVPYEIYKTYKEWKVETTLSEYKIRKCIKLAKKMGFLHTYVKKVKGNPTLHYIFLIEKFTDAFTEYLNDGYLSFLSNETEKTTATKLKKPQQPGTETTINPDITAETPHSPPASGREAGELKPIFNDLSTATKDLPVEYNKIKLSKKYESLPLSFREEVEAVISYLNSAAAKNYRYSSTPALKKILARFREGFTVADMKRVIDSKVADWKDNPEMCKYLSPATLFSAEHFETYLDEAPVLENKKEVKQVSWEERKRATFIKNAVNKIQEEKGLPKYKSHTDIPGGYEQYAYLVPNSVLNAN